MPGTVPPPAGNNMEFAQTIKNHSYLGLLSAFSMPELHILGGKGVFGFVWFSNNSNIIDLSKTMKLTSVKKQAALASSA